MARTPIGYISPDGLKALAKGQQASIMPFKAYPTDEPLYMALADATPVATRPSSDLVRHTYQGHPFMPGAEGKQHEPEPQGRTIGEATNKGNENALDYS